MKNKLTPCKFKDCDLKDKFFDTLKYDYPYFETWFQKKFDENVYVYKEEGNVKAFLYLKFDENECIMLRDKVLPIETRIKIGTLKISETSQGQRIGEGMIGFCLWEWQKRDENQIYITVFSKHKSLILILERFGFSLTGETLTGECFYMKDKRSINTKTPYSSFPYINDSNSNISGLIPIYDNFHDTLFQYSELANTNQECNEISAANGITKTFIATPSSMISYKTGEIAFIYRKYNGQGLKKYKSVITSYCTIVEQLNVKCSSKYICNFNEFKTMVGNCSVYTDDELRSIYYDYSYKNIVILKMIYNGFFGKGRNLTWDFLNTHGLMEKYPYAQKYSKEQTRFILESGGVNVQNTFIY